MAENTWLSTNRLQSVVTPTALISVPERESRDYTPAVIMLGSLIGRSVLKHINTITLMTNSSLSNAAATASTAEIYSIYFTNHETKSSDSTYCCYDLYSLVSGTEKSALIPNWFQLGWLTLLFSQCGTIKHKIKIVACKSIIFLSQFCKKPLTNRSQMQNTFGHYYPN